MGASCERRPRQAPMEAAAAAAAARKPKQPPTYPMLQVVQGFLDALSVHKTFIYYYLSRTLVVRTMQCVALNGIIFLGSIALVEYLLLPVVYALLYYDEANLQPPLSHIIHVTYQLMGFCFNM